MGTGIRKLTDRDQFIEAVRRVATRDRNGFANPEDVATELRIGLFELTELVRRYPGISSGISFRSENSSSAQGSSRASIESAVEQETGFLVGASISEAVHPLHLGNDTVWGSSKPLPR